ncbi:Piwi-domain-containing protein [Coprinopsis marcescibilis]|uniref:Piwi-domain-containing protein n=1 Tax=Coprinopsis marcescibilis TaxID=230819 RepID=A0A5C3L9R7_COPMA|nr:Piwi-domain-containing protein [Coprinopsis marcescibilis]
MSNQVIRKVQLITNFFVIDRLPVGVYSQYDVVIEPEVKGNKGGVARKKQLLMDHLQSIVAPNYFPMPVFYDGGAVCYAAEQTTSLLGPAQQFHVSLRSERLLDPSAWNDKKKTPCVRITLTKTSGDDITNEQLSQIVANPNDPRRELMANFLQLILRQNTNNKHPGNGKAFFVDYSDRHPMKKFMKGLTLPNGLLLRRGIFHSIRQSLDRMTVMIDASTAAFYPKGRLIDVIVMFLSKPGMPMDARHLDRALAELSTFNKMKDCFKGLRIKLDTSPATKIIRGFIPRGGQYLFEKDGREITVKDHYYEAYRIVLKYPDAPGVVLQERPFKVVVPMEICDVLEGQLFRKKLPDQYTAAMVKIATIAPRERQDFIRAAAQQYQTNPDMAVTGMRVDVNPLTVQGKLLPTPTIVYKNSEQFVKDGKWNVVRSRFFNSAILKLWAVLNLERMQISPDDVGRKIREMSSCMKELGIGEQHPIAVEAESSSHVREGIEKIRAACNSALARTDPTLSLDRRDVRDNFILFVILPDDAAIPRKELKYYCDVVYGYKTQCMRASKFKKSNNQYHNNVLLKINARLGGTNNILNDTKVLHYLFRKNRTMIVGADVGHPGPGTWNKPSTTGLVFSVDQHATQYQALTRVQMPRQEHIEDLTEMMLLALTKFSHKAGGPPQNLIFYRDGVSEGEYERVRTMEFPKIQAAIDAFIEQNKHRGPIPLPRITFVVVGKRHHALLFPGQDDIRDKTGNCSAGVTVDSGITQPHIPNFYLQSHAAIQGTSRSSHYIVLKNEVFNNDITPLQELSFALCHIYAKATRSVSIPAPVYYADLVCGRDLFHVDPRSRLTFEDNHSVASSGSETFDLSVWKAAYQQVHEDMSRNMYFL